MLDNMKKIGPFTVILLLCLTSSAWTATYYIDPAGTNRPGCGLAPGASACATLSYLVVTQGHGSHDCSIGDSIHIGAGSYTDNTAVGHVGLNWSILGAGKGTTTITTNKSKYITLQTPVPVVNGNNEISGFNLVASAANSNGILSSGRNNQKIHDMSFTSWSTENMSDSGSALTVDGKYGANDSTGGFYKTICAGGEPSCTWCQGVGAIHTAPLSTDWATGVLIYNNTFTNSKLMINVLRGAMIYNNTFNNANETNISGIGHTSFWNSGNHIYNNVLNMNSLATTTIAIELWGIGGDTKFYNNTINGWSSFVGGDIGKVATPYSLEIYGNNFYIAKAMTGALAQVEVNGNSSSLSNVIIYKNYFASSAIDRGCSCALGLWARTTLSNVFVFYNVFGTNWWDGANRDLVEVEDIGAGATLTNINIFNNVFDGGANRIGGLVYQQNSSSILTNTTWVNNLFMNMYGDVKLSGSSGMAGHVSNHNYSYNLGAGGSWGAVRGSYWSTNSNNVNTSTSPGIIGSGNKPDPYYRLTSGSPCIEAGTNVGLTSDYGGTTVPHGTAPDIGAFEWTGAIPGSPSGLRLVE